MKFFAIFKDHGLKITRVVLDPIVKFFNIFGFENIDKLSGAANEILLSRTTRKHFA
jgi:hypothetical protein